MCWGHIISPEAARRALVEWLDAVPANKISAFGGDYCFVEGVYGHQWLARRNVAASLAQKVADGSMDLERAKEIALSLQERTGNPRYYADTTYYLGKAHYMLGDRSQAKQYFQMYLAVDEPLLAHREEVRDLLKSLP